MAVGSIPNLGIGVGLRVPHLRYVHEQAPSVDFFEIISENFMIDGGLPLRNLDWVVERYPVTLHGVSLSIASAAPLDYGYLARLKALARRTRTPYVTDHLCWTTAHGSNTHDLLPIPYTERFADYVAAKARIVQDYLELPFGLENLSSYVAFNRSEMTEWEFVARVIDRAGCYLLLDVNNVHVSSVNHGFDGRDYVDGVPWDRVLEIHVAGQQPPEDGVVLDTHDDVVKPEVWELYRVIYAQCGGASTLLEWDDHFIPFDQTYAEALKARTYQHDSAPR